MQMQRRLHVECDVFNAHRVWQTDAEIQEALVRSLGVPPNRRDCTPSGSAGLGIRWYEAGTGFFCGFVPVSDGTDIVVQWRHGVGAWVDKLTLGRRQRRFQDFCSTLAERLALRTRA